MARRVVIVDRNKDSQDILRAILEHYGYEVLGARTGAEAVERIRETPPDLVIVDFPVPMPGGSTLTATLKATPETGSIPILAVTNRALAHEQLAAREAGCDEVCTKPVDPRVVAVTVRQMIGPAEADAEPELEA